jgi:hypothetical protein
LPATAPNFTVTDEKKKFFFLNKKEEARRMETRMNILQVRLLAPGNPYRRERASTVDLLLKIGRFGKNIYSFYKKTN